MIWLVSALVSISILIWAVYPRQVVYSDLGYDEIAGAIRLAAGLALIVLLWTGSLVLAFLGTP